jgi:hypothetical protein
MKLMVDIDIKKLAPPLKYGDRMLLTGSCFTEHIGNALLGLKFPVLQNPHGILFDPVSVCKSLLSYASNKKYSTKDLFLLNDVWHSWEHHSRFSNTDPEKAIQLINENQEHAHGFLKQADWLLVTLGSSFSYRLTQEGLHASASASHKEGEGVANCHRAPASWFKKQMLSTAETSALLKNCFEQLKTFNPGLNILITVSPVRHIRDGVIQNTRSKARLIEAVHQVVEDDNYIHYFPAYELVIDVLRDYRFFDADLVHPNYLATEFVLEKFTASCIDESSHELMKAIRSITIARKHKALQPDTSAHRRFLNEHAEKARMLMEKYPFLDLSEELDYFNS